MVDQAAGDGETLGINGLGRIGKLTVWEAVARRRFGHLVVNTGRMVGQSADDLAHYIEHDSTYGSLGQYLHGRSGLGKPAVKVVDSSVPLLEIDGVEVTVLVEDRDPREIAWKENGAGLVIDTTGRFRDPTVPADAPGGSLRGHLEAGASLVVTSAPFKLKGADRKLPEDSVMLIQGINHHAFEPGTHCLVSAASCTTTALAHMMLPLLQYELTHRILTASMSTIHASTNSQSVLDKVPKTGAKDLRKTRSVFNNIILTSTGAAQALERVVPEIASIGFLADSVRVPLSTASLIILNCTFQSQLDEVGASLINRDSINNIYEEYAATSGGGAVFSEQQNVSTDMIGTPAAVVIEGTETHARTGFTRVNLNELGIDAIEGLGEIEVPVTHLKVFGWYDNELGSYTQRMTDLVHHIADLVTV